MRSRLLLAVLAAHLCGCGAGGPAPDGGFGDGGQGSPDGGAMFTDGGCLLPPKPACITDSCRRATAVAASGWKACALLGDGRVICWGSNSLGPGCGTGHDDPRLVPGLEEIVELSIPCARRRDGAVLCWGDAHSPEWPDVPRRWVLPAAAIDIGGRCAVVEGGEVWCRDAFETDAHRIDGIGDAVAVSSGLAHACVLLGDETVWCWGSATLYDGSRFFGDAPAMVPGLGGVAQIASGVGDSPHEYVCARTSSGALYCWGANWLGRIGDGNDVDRPLPSLVPLAGVSHVAVGDGAHTCALSDGGTVSCWGYSELGQLGEKTLSFRRVLPLQPAGMPAMLDIAVGGLGTCAVGGAGEVFCWGGGSADRRRVSW